MLNKKKFARTLALVLGFSLVVGSISLPLSTNVAYAEEESVVDVEPFSNYTEAESLLNFVADNLSRFVEEYNKTLTQLVKKSE